MRGRTLLLVLPLLMMSWTPATMSLEEARPTREAAGDGTYDVLMLGNSYTSQNSLSSRVQALFDASGNSANVSDLTGGGMKLYQHADNAESSGNQWNTALTTSQYEFVILQDQSQVPSFPTTESYWQNSKNGAIRLDSMIEAAGAETIFFMTWGYRDGDSQNAWLNPDYPTMQANLESGYKMYAENLTTSEREAYIAPVGLAFKEIYDDIIEEGGVPTDSGTLFHNLYAGDGSHPSTSGTYLAACVLHSTITGDSSIGLPDQFGLDSNTRIKLQQASDSVVFDEDLNYVYPWQSEASNISFGSQSGLNLMQPPGGAVGVSVNITNNASFSEVVNISVSSTTGWDVSWAYGDGNAMNGSNLVLASDEMKWIQFSIFVPHIEGGMPLAFSKHSFNVVGISGHDSAQIVWTFTIEVLPWHGAEIVSQPTNGTVDPDEKIRIPVTVRNLGNIEKSLEVRIRPVTENGEDISGHSPASFFEENGWSAGIFEPYRVTNLAPYESGTVQVEIDSPNLATGTMWVELSTWSRGDAQQISITRFQVGIVRTWGASMSVVHDCDEMMPGATCTGYVTLQNSGNFESAFSLDMGTLTENIDCSLEETQFSIPKGQSVVTEFSIMLDDDLLADITESVELKLIDSGNGTVYQSEIISATAETIYGWEIISVEEIIHKDKRVTYEFHLRNTGNAPDGLIVSVSTNILTDTLDLRGANGETPSEDSPDRISLQNIQPNGDATYSVWMMLPKEQESSGVAELVIETRSELEPSIIFINRTTHQYLIEKWIEIDAEEEDMWGNALEEFKGAWNNWNHVFLSIIVIIIGSMMLYRAVEYRQRKDAEWAALHATHEKIPEKVEDWVGKFNKDGGTIASQIQSPEMPADAFTAAFKSKSAPPKSQNVQISAAVVEAAQTVLEHHEEKMDYAAIEDLSEGLLDVEEPHEANDDLSDVTAITGRTVRHEKRDVSKKDTGDDDLDLDL